MPRRVVVGMSGGVDSSVAALLLKQRGDDVVGLFMKNWEDDDTDEYCSSRSDLVDAVAVADRLDIEIETVNFSAEYKDRVFSEFLREYQAGRTPNPDILCNAEIKFRAFLDHALALGADCIATGHYARTGEDEGQVALLRGSDPTKDQSYFLHRLNRAQLARTLFPVGGLRKTDVREIAREAGLAVHDKKDSTGICFIGERPFREFLNRYLPTEPGDICTLEGEVVGHHMGLMYYTLGQRQGLGIGGRASGSGGAWYVAAKELSRNRLVVVQGHDHPSLLKTELTCSQVHWIAGQPPGGDRALTGKTRYRQVDRTCRIVTMEGDSCRIRFDEQQWAVTPGQSVVLYDGDVCLGGGIID